MEVVWTSSTNGPWRFLLIHTNDLRESMLLSGCNLGFGMFQVFLPVDIYSDAGMSMRRMLAHHHRRVL